MMYNQSDMIKYEVRCFESFLSLEITAEILSKLWKAVEIDSFDILVTMEIKANEK